MNTENQERMFGQCRQIAEKVTNRHTQNLILRMKAKHMHASSHHDTIKSSLRPQPSLF